MLSKTRAVVSSGDKLSSPPVLGQFFFNDVANAGSILVSLYIRVRIIEHFTWPIVCAPTRKKKQNKTNKQKRSQGEEKYIKIQGLNPHPHRGVRLFGERDYH